jgi:hypothetical protein
MASDNEQDLHSIWNGRFKANPKEAKFFLEIVDKLGLQFDGMPVDEILQTFWGEPRDVLEKLIKKSNKREKKEEAKFDAKTLKRAPSANILFQKDFKAKCDSKGIKFNLKTCVEEYKKLTDKDKAKYQKESLRMKEEYNAEYARLRNEAIKNGDFPEDKPKRPLSGFLRYLADVREEITEKYKDVVDRKKINAQISKDAGEMWNALSDKEKAPYEIAYKKEKEAYEIKQKAWDNNEQVRLKKTGTEPASKSVPVKIETAGSAKKVEPKAKVNKIVEVHVPDTDNDNDTDNDSNNNSDEEMEEMEEMEEVVEEVKKTTVPKPTVKKTPSNSKLVNIDDDEEEKEVSKPKLIGKAKATKTK